MYYEAGSGSCHMLWCVLPTASVLRSCMHIREGPPILVGGLAAMASHWSSVHAHTPGGYLCPGEWLGSLVLIGHQFMHAHLEGPPVLVGDLALAYHWLSVHACAPGGNLCPGEWLGSGFSEERSEWLSSGTSSVAVAFLQSICDSATGRKTTS